MNETRTKTMMNGWVLAVLIALSVPALGQNVVVKNAVLITHKHRVVLVSVPDRKLAVLENGAVVRKFNVAVGASTSPSPVGEFQIVNRIVDPTYYRAGAVIPPGKSNPVGPRWVGLSKKGYGIHGTNEPRSIGKARSHGCIRLNNVDVQELFDLVSVGDTVEVRGVRDEEIVQIFGGAVAPQGPPAPVQTASLAPVSAGQ